MSFIAGSLNGLEQHFNLTVAQSSCSMLVLTLAAFRLPAAFHLASPPSPLRDAAIAWISCGISLILLSVYVAYLIFQLRTYRSLYRTNGRDLLVTAGTDYGTGTPRATDSPTPTSTSDDDNMETSEAPELSIWMAVLLLATRTVFVAECAECLVSSVDPLVTSLNISRMFVGLVLLPIVRNAAEHTTAITAAYKNEMDLGLSIAVGSSLQISLLVIPFTVKLGWCLGSDDMTLYFTPFPFISLWISVLLVIVVIQILLPPGRL